MGMIRSMVLFLIVLGVIFITVPASAGITPIGRWTPKNATDFKTAAVCHFQKSDDYGVFAVFHVCPPFALCTNELWYLQIDGRSASGNYGQIVMAERLASEAVISHVDCATDGGSTAYVVWDRSDDPFDTRNARWGGVDLDGGLTGPFEVPSCEGAGASFGNGIAYHEGSIAISGGGRGRCAFCSYVWPDVSDPATVVQQIIWLDGQSPKTTDIIWNKRDSFLLAALLKFDGTGRPAVVTTQIAPDGSYVDHAVLSDPLWDTSNYNAVYIVFSDHDPAVDGYALLQTDQRTFWTDLWGNPIGSPQTVGPWERFPSCEYWGRNRRIAHTYTGSLSGTTHREWPDTPNPAVNIYAVTGKYLMPVACGSSTDFRDPEILLIRKSTLKDSGTLYYNFESQD